MTNAKPKAKKRREAPPKVEKGLILGRVDKVARDPQKMERVRGAFYPGSGGERKELTAQELADLAREVGVAGSDEEVTYLVKHWGKSKHMKLINEKFCALVDAVHEYQLPVSAWWIKSDAVKKLDLQVVCEHDQIGFFVISKPPSRKDLKRVQKILGALIAKS